MSLRTVESAYLLMEAVSCVPCYLVEDMLNEQHNLTSVDA